MVRRILRIAAGILLIFLIFPPISLGVLNIFVIIPAFIGILLLFLPPLLALLRRACGRRYRFVLHLAAAALIVCGVFFCAESAVLFANAGPDVLPARGTVIVPGARANGDVPTILLWGRIDAAGRYLKSHPGSVCVATGARGADETESEAKCISDWLRKKYGISKNRIYLDDQSRSTAQNFTNAKKIIEKYDLPRQSVIATDGYHMLRCKIIARRRGLTPYSCPARTDSRLLLQCTLRELLALPKTVMTD